MMGTPITLTAQILGASLCAGAINYFSTKADLDTPGAVIRFALLCLPLSLVATALFSLYYANASQIAFGSLMLGGYAALFVVGLGTQTIVLGQPVDGRQICAFVLFGAGVAVLATRPE